MTLDSLKPQIPAEIISVDWDQLAPEEAKRLQALGIDEGAQISIANRGIFFGRDPMTVEVGRMTLALRRVHAKAMTVREI